jgi:hypothetical protein
VNSFRGLLAIGALSLASCGGETEPIEVHEAIVQPKPPRPRPAVPPPPSVPLERGLGPDAQLEAAELDPRGEAALTLDAVGGVLLWPSFDLADPSKCTPFTLVADEPLWMSLAKSGPHAFTVGLIDTANLARVYRVELADASARMTELFALPIGDPLLELHVLDGGERILTLGIDHRVSLYDASGRLLSQIAERGFVPWQLRVVGPKLAVVLDRPVRVQGLSLVGDQLALRGEAREVELDRGPNRNDLALSPDGNTVAALRRDGNVREFSIELIDLDSGTRKLVGGRVNANVRPRMHFVSPTQLLLESGVWDSGFVVPLDGAVDVQERAEALPDSKLAKRLGKLEHERITLVGASERVERLPDDDQGRRFDTSVTNGVRVAIHDRTLIVDVLDDPGHVEFGYASLLDSAVLDATGARVAWIEERRIDIETVADGTIHGFAWDPPFQIWDLRLMAWIGDEHLLFAADAWIVLTRVDGEESTREYLGGQSGRRFALRRDRAGEQLGFGYVDDRDSWSVVELRDGRLQPARPMDAAERDAWSCGFLSHYDADWCVMASDGRRITVDTSVYPRSLTVQDADATRSIELPGGEPRRLLPSPDATRLAVVLGREVKDEDEMPIGSDTVLAIYDMQTGQRLWLRGFIGGSGNTSVEWAGDARSLVLVHDRRGHVFAAHDGELRTRWHNGFRAAHVSK